MDKVPTFAQLLSFWEKKFIAVNGQILKSNQAIWSHRPQGAFRHDLLRARLGYLSGQEIFWSIPATILRCEIRHGVIATLSTTQFH